MSKLTVKPKGKVIAQVTREALILSALACGVSACAVGEEAVGVNVPQGGEVNGGTTGGVDFIGESGGIEVVGLPPEGGDMTEPQPEPVGLQVEPMGGDMGGEPGETVGLPPEGGDMTEPEPVGLPAEPMGGDMGGEPGAMEGN